MLEVFEWFIVIMSLNCRQSMAFVGREEEEEGGGGGVTEDELTAGGGGGLTILVCIGSSSMDLVHSLRRRFCMGIEVDGNDTDTLYVIIGTSLNDSSSGENVDMLVDNCEGRAPAQRVI